MDRKLLERYCLFSDNLQSSADHTDCKLFAKRTDQVEMSSGDSEPMVKLVSNEACQALVCDVLLIMMDHFNSSVLFSDLATQYHQMFGSDLRLTQLQNELSGFVEVMSRCLNILSSSSSKTVVMCSHRLNTLS